MELTNDVSSPDTSQITGKSNLWRHPQPNCRALKTAIIQWNLVITRSDITKSSYKQVILLVPVLYISLFFYPDMRNLI